ncbi:hypothetical protein [Costertonia aggregata]|uniref:Uncharacterized protein n=1 Tax=Costertonia aggregata TaxID=343403 RepID=A0A7H9AS82_9FLAO|nr:hypothetical protein [Costertonia aggregata]QLG46055.1 hypothetical protein HYG79_12100 [Costertonia aggregata]
MCLLNSGRNVPQCKDSIGGLKNAYFINFLEDAFTVENAEATAINAGVAEVFKYGLRNDGNNLSESIVSDKNTGTTTNTQTLTLALAKLDKDTALQVDLMSKGRPIIIVQDRNDNYKIVGLSEGCDLTGSSIDSGGARSDFSGFNLTLTAMESSVAPFLDSATITALEALVSATNIAA